MRKFVYLVFLGMAGTFLFSGCASSNGRVDAKMLTKDNTVKGMNTRWAFTPVPNTRGYVGYQDSENAEYKCSVEFTIHAIATKALENGYPYFSLEFTKGSNQKPMAIVTSNKMARYCAAPYYDKESNLLDDKCHHIGLGQGTPSSIKRVKAYFYKNRNPFTPLWDARKAIRDTRPELVKTCWNGNEQLFRKALLRYNEFGSEELE